MDGEFRKTGRTTTGAGRGPRPHIDVRAALVFAGLLPLTALLTALIGVAALPGADPLIIAAGTLAQILASLTLLTAYRRPLLPVLSVAAVGIAMGLVPFWRELILLGGVVWLPAALPGATDALLRRARSPVQLVIGGSALAAYVAVATADAAVAGGSPLAAALGAGAPILAGVSISFGIRLAHARRDRVAQAARDRIAVVERVRADERNRLAMEMHDTVTHRITLLVLHANSMATGTADPAARASAQEMSRIGTLALTELRDFLGLLRNPDAPITRPAAPDKRPAAPDVPGIASLVDEARGVGETVELRERGTPGGASPAVQRAAHRVAQEALTNARKHAPGAPVRITVDHGPDHMEIAIENGPPDAAVPTPLDGTGGGTGLLGLERRVGLLGGTFAAGPRPDGGFRVAARLPVHDGVAA